MRIALLSDIHGNDIAFEAVLDDAQALMDYIISFQMGKVKGRIPTPDHSTL